MLLASNAEDSTHGSALGLQAPFPAPVFTQAERKDFLLAARQKKYNLEVVICKDSVKLALIH